MTTLAEPPTGPQGPHEAPLDALVVLGCRVRQDGSPSAPLRRRVDHAAALFHSGIARWVVMSGGRQWGTIREADAMLERWRALGLDPQPVLLEHDSLTTRGNAHCSAALLRRRQLTRVGIVTCDFHLPRALRYFGAEGLVVRGFAVPARRGALTRAWLWGRERGALLLDPFAQRRGAHWLTPPSEHPQETETHQARPAAKQGLETDDHR